jgi:hypothetical protein
VLQWIDDTELQHWACTAAARAAVGAVAVGDARLAAFQKDGSAATAPAAFQARACRVLCCAVPALLGSLLPASGSCRSCC